MNSSRILQLTCLFVCLLLSLNGLQAADKNTRDNYRLGTGDNIRIHVFQEEDLSIETRISDTGTVSYPLLGIIRVSGLSVAQLEDKITSGLKGDYLINPRVNVSVLDYREFFVNGEVKKPGSYPYVPGLTVRKAISIAGGFEERADKEKLMILHEDNPKGEPQKIDIDAKIRPGDILTVEQSFF